MRGWFVVATVLSLVCAIPRATHAEAADIEGRKHFDEGTKAFNLGEFDRAAAEYRAAYELKPDPTILYNLAQAYRLGSKLPQALFFYRSYLHSEPNATNRDEVSERIQKLEKQIAVQQRLTTEPPNTTRAQAESTSPPVLTVEARHVEPAKRPAHKKWWVWTIVGVAAAGAGIGLGIGLSRPSAPSSQLGNTVVF